MQPNNDPYNQAPPMGQNQPMQAQGYPGMPPQMSGSPQMGPPVQPVSQQPIMPSAQNQQAIGGQQVSNPVPKNPNSTQNTLLLSEIRDNMVIMNDGTYRVVIGCKSINFDLMSDREREGIEYSYQNFLNSLNFPVQILVRSQRVDIGPYIDKLANIRRTQDNMLLGVLMDDYIGFIDALSQEANIMEKTFYVVIPFFPSGDAANLVEQGKGFFGKIFAKSQNTTTKIDAASYQKAKDELKNRADSVMAGLFQLGVQSGQLGTRALSELYYNYYNPDTAVRQPILEPNELATTFVMKGNPNTQSQPGGNF